VTDLVLAGDWTRTPLNLGCVEAAVMSGLLAARAVSGCDVPIVGEDDEFVWAGVGLGGRASSPVARVRVPPSAPVAGSIAPPPNASFIDPATFVRDLGAALDAFRGDEVAALCARLRQHLLLRGEPFPADAAGQVLSRLRRKCRFDLLRSVADAFVQSGQAAPAIRRQYAQALIDRTDYTGALMILQALAAERPVDDREGQEARGLIGRVYKQQFVDASRIGAPLARPALAKAIAAYHEVYAHAPEALWHGINVVALAARARGADWPLPPGVDPDVIAPRILAAVTAKGNAADAWDVATAVEACVALGRNQEANVWLGRYLAAPGTDAFELASTLRQLQEIWLLVPDVEPGESLLPKLRAEHLLREGAEAIFDARTVRAGLQRNHGLDGAVSLAWFRRALERCRLVGHIEDRLTGASGTGFLIRAGDILPAGYVDPAEWLLLTSAHVLGDDRDAIRPSDAVVRFETLEIEGRAPCEHRVERVLWSSPVTALDATIARLDPPIAAAPELPIADQAPDTARRQRVYVIGYPGGRVLSLSINDNILLGLRDGHLEYRSPTERGSSGSPVFDDRWNLIGLHRGETAHDCNEGIWIGAIRAAARG
jgi:hypothetical protein